ncbi:hypothetical protein UFOVP331_40 [uncultured Caudovirales phage]|uniref:Uncharacterized protein n=1 Tax=uncultured Caudovirales phage TaxID=2100421 RepID=A0A6J5LV12_9CAUD|nr:hypothetical protein UFOVP331_40 [uncultured Caudovirales phage]
MTTIIDPPSGWKYGFPKPIPEDRKNDVLVWLVEQGYPQSEIDGLGEIFTNCCRYWEEEEPKQETLEEAAKSNYDNKTSRLPVPTSHWINSEFLQIQNFKEGAKWQEERMFEIMDSYVDDVMGGCNLRAKDWFQEFKNK